MFWYGHTVHTEKDISKSWNIKTALEFEKTLESCMCSTYQVSCHFMRQSLWNEWLHSTVSIPATDSSCKSNAKW